MAKSKRQRTHKKGFKKIVWSKDEEEILRRHREEWLEQNNKDDRTEFCVRVGEKIRDLCPERYGLLVIERNKDLKEEWERRFKGIKTWFNNHRGLTKNRRVFKFERKIQLRNVIAHFKHDEIEEEVLRLCPGEKPGSRVYFRYYQKALAHIKDSLGKQEINFYLEKQKEWQAKSPPEAVQQRLNRAAKKYGKRIILNMHEVALKQMGMHAVTIEAHRNEDGALGLTFHDYSRDLAGPGVHFQSFLEFNRKACATFSKAFGEWIMKVLEVTEGNSPSMDDGKPVIALTKGPGGIPILPPPIISHGRSEHLKTQREIIREFFRIHYRVACNNERAAPPWEAMGKNPEKFFWPEDIPESFVFRDPTRMSGKEVQSLLAYLRNRQENETVTSFSFRQVLQDGKDGRFIKAKYPLEAALLRTTVAPPSLSHSGESESDMDEAEELSPSNPTLTLQQDARLGGNTHPVGGNTPPVGGNTSVVGGNTPPVGGNTSTMEGNASEVGGNPAVGGNTHPVRGNTPPVGGNTSIVGGNTPPVGRNTSAMEGNASEVGGNPAVGGNTHPVRGNTPPVGGNTSIVGGNTPPVGGNTSAVEGNTRPVGNPLSGPHSNLDTQSYDQGIVNRGLDSTYHNEVPLQNFVPVDDFITPTPSVDDQAPNLSSHRLLQDSQSMDILSASSPLLGNTHSNTLPPVAGISMRDDAMGRQTSNIPIGHPTGHQQYFPHPTSYHIGYPPAMGYPGYYPPAPRYYVPHTYQHPAYGWLPNSHYGIPVSRQGTDIAAGQPSRGDDSNQLEGGTLSGGDMTSQRGGETFQAENVTVGDTETPVSESGPGSESGSVNSGRRRRKKNDVVKSSRTLRSSGNTETPKEHK